MRWSFSFCDPMPQSSKNAPRKAFLCSPFRSSKFPMVGSALHWLQTCSMSSWNIPGAPCRPNGMQFQRKTLPEGVQNAVRSFALSDMPTCQKPDLRSSLLFQWHEAIPSIICSMLGRYAAWHFVISLTFLYCPTILRVLDSFFWTRKVGEQWVGNFPLGNGSANFASTNSWTCLSISKESSSGMGQHLLLICFPLNSSLSSKSIWTNWQPAPGGGSGPKISLYFRSKDFKIGLSEYFSKSFSNSPCKFSVSLSKMFSSSFDEANCLSTSEILWLRSITMSCMSWSEITKCEEGIPLLSLVKSWSAAHLNRISSLGMICWEEWKSLSENSTSTSGRNSNTNLSFVGDLTWWLTESR